MVSASVTHSRVSVATRILRAPLSVVGGMQFLRLAFNLLRGFGTPVRLLGHGMSEFHSS
jgi:hypothetical protein